LEPPEGIRACDVEDTAGVLAVRAIPKFVPDTTRGLGATEKEFIDFPRGDTGRAVEFCNDKGESGRLVEE